MPLIVITISFAFLSIQAIQRNVKLKRNHKYEPIVNGQDINGLPNGYGAGAPDTADEDTEDADWVRSTSTTLAGGLDWDLNAESLKVDDSRKDEEGRDEVHDVGEILSVEGFVKGTLLIWPCQEQVKERNDSAFEFWPTACVNGGRGESLPDDRLADVCGNEKRDTASKAVSLLEKFVQENNNQASNNQLEDEEEDNTSAKIRWLPVESSEHVYGSLSHR